MDFKECFIIKLIGIEKITYIDSFIKLNEIMLSNGEEIIAIKNRKFTKDINYDKNEIFLYLENSSDKFTERIDYLLDEDYEIEKLDLEIIYNGRNLNYKYELLEQIEFNTIKNNFLDGLKNEFFKNRTACITGLKSSSLYGFNYKDKRYMDLYKEVQDKCEYLIKEYGISIFLTGGKIGTEAISFFAIENLKEKYPNILNIVALPFRKYGNGLRQYKYDYDRYNKIIKKADFIIYVDEIPEYDIEIVCRGEYHNLKDYRKDTFMIDKSKALIIFWNRKDRECMNRINQAQVKGLNIFELLRN